MQSSYTLKSCTAIPCADHIHFIAFLQLFHLYMKPHFSQQFQSIYVFLFLNASSITLWCACWPKRWESLSHFIWMLKQSENSSLSISLILSLKEIDRQEGRQNVSYEPMKYVGAGFNWRDPDSNLLPGIKLHNPRYLGPSSLLHINLSAINYNIWLERTTHASLSLLEGRYRCSKINEFYEGT